MIRRIDSPLTPIDANDYLINPSGHDWGKILADWHWKLPAEFTLWLVNLYGDLFMVPEDGSVHMLEIGYGTLECIAESRDGFSDGLDLDANANQWLKIPLVQRCHNSGMSLEFGECFSFKVLPILGGEYSVENSEVCNLDVHYSIHGQIHEQIKDLPDGTQIDVVRDDDRR